MIARAKSGQARDDMSEFDAAEIAHDIGELYEPLAEQKGITLKVEADAPAPVRANRELVSQALANLVDNAIKYTEPSSQAVNGAVPEIVVRALNEGDRIMLTVADNGPGIPEADRARVVERFVRLEQSRSKPGSGLGLSLASAVSRLHGGELTLADNEPGLKSIIALPRGGPVKIGGWRRPAKKKPVRKKALRKKALRKKPMSLLRAKSGVAGSPPKAGDVTLAARIVTAPCSIEPKTTRARMAEWLSGLHASQKANRSRHCSLPVLLSARCSKA